MADDKPGKTTVPDMADNRVEDKPKDMAGRQDAGSEYRDAFARPEPHNAVRTPRLKALSLVLLLLASMSAGFLGGWVGAARGADGDDLSPAAQQQVVSGESQLISSIAKTVGPSVVSIDVTSQRESGSLFGYGGTRQAQSAGTGIVLTANGLIVTNRHVVDGATDVSVTLADGTQLDDVEIVGRTRASDPLDIAFLKIRDAKGKKLAPAKIGDSSKIQVGDRVVAIGNAPGQFQNTVTSGIISGYGREVQAGGESGGDVESLQDLFQTDAAINQGNSGGPLVNTSGEVIGINTAVAGGDAQDIGFAIPVNNISGLIKSVIATGELKQPYLGVRYLSLTNDIAQEFGLKVIRGAYVLPADQTGQPAVVPDSPADKAGLQGGDVILQVNGTKVDESHSLSSLLARQSIGDGVTLKVLREGRERDIKATLEAAPSEELQQQ